MPRTAKLKEWKGATDDARALAEYARSVLRYDPITGAFIRTKRTGRNVVVGAEAGTLKNGYRFIRLHGIKYAAHRLAWLIVHGEFPAGQIDHINGNPSDNRISNLRVVTLEQNMLNKKRYVNNSSGHKGVSFHRATGKYQARVYRSRRCLNLGLFDTAEAAAKAYNDAALKLHGSFCRAEGSR